MKRRFNFTCISLLTKCYQQYLKDSSNRASQFGISLNAENYTPGEETFKQMF
nr:hypothetical protein [Entomoplasma sp. MP1]